MTTPPRGTVPPSQADDNPDKRDELDAEERSPELDPFDGDVSIGTALENLRHRVGTIETFARAASDAMDAVPYIADGKTRRRVERVGVLVRATTDAAIEALEFADAAVRLLRQYLGEKRGKTTVLK